MLSIENLSKTYPNGVKSLQNVSLEIGKGMFGLLGPNGAGKSTLMRTIATLQMPDSGSIVFDGVEILKDPFSLRKVLGYLPQEFGVYPNRSADDLLNYFGILKGISSSKQRAMLIEEVLELTNLLADRKKSVSSYSGGMKQRFGIAQLLLNNPALIIVDEPTAGLDPAERKRFLNVLREISSQKVVIFSTHLVEDVNELCSDLAMIKSGCIVKNDKPKNCVLGLKNRVWQTSVSADNLSSFSEQYQLLSSSFSADNSMAVRVYAEQKPSDDFFSVTASLEDAYFLHLGPQSNA